MIEHLEGLFSYLAADFDERRLRGHWRASFSTEDNIPGVDCEGLVTREDESVDFIAQFGRESAEERVLHQGGGMIEVAFSSLVCSVDGAPIETLVYAEFLGARCSGAVAVENLAEKVSEISAAEAGKK